MSFKAYASVHNPYCTLYIYLLMYSVTLAGILEYFNDENACSQYSVLGFALIRRASTLHGVFM